MAVVQFTSAELDAHKTWMDDAQDKKDEVREALEAKDLKKLVAAAVDLDRITERETRFWARTSMERAKEVAAKNRGESKELLDAARGGRWEAAGAAFGRLERTCASCHDQHFEKDFTR